MGSPRLSGGATQWHVPCPHTEHRSADYAMASQVSRSNLEFFISEGRVSPDVSKDDLRDWHERAVESDASLVVCNYCDRVMVVGDGDPGILHDGGDRR